MTNKLNYILVASNAGGEGKTTISKLLKAVYKIGGAESVIIDADYGNFAAKNKDENALTVGWGVTPSYASDIVARTNGHHAIMDLGANTMASAREIVDTLPEIAKLYEEQGRSCIAFLPVSTNKDGAIGAINNLEDKLELYDKYIVKVNRDSSNNFDGNIQSQKVLTLEYLKPGFQALISENYDSMASAIMEPQKDHTIAATYLAKWIYDFVSQEGMPDIFDDNILEKVKSYSTDPIKLTRFNITCSSQCTNEALNENIKKTRIIQLLDRYGWNKNGLIEASRNIGY